MNLSDLMVVVVLGSAVYAVVAAVAGRGHFLTRAVNPHRLSWVIAAASVLWVGIGLMRLEAGSWAGEDWVNVLGQLVTDQPTPARAKAAAMALLLSLVFFVLVTWCWACLPRDPITFHRPEDRKAAFKYYVTTLKGGLDYAMLASGDGECLEEEMSAKQVSKRCPHLPKILPEGSDTPRVRTTEDQLTFWRQMAFQIHRRMKELDAMIEPANHGRNRRINFDAEFGGLFFKYLRLSDAGSKVDSSLYLFGATLNQLEMNNGRAMQQFQLLLDALDNIDRAIRVG